MQRSADASAGPRAKIAGVVYLLYFLSASTGALLMNGIVSASAVTTAANITAHETLYRSGLAFDLVGNALYIALTALFYVLFEPVSRRASLLAAFFGLAGCTIQMFGSVFRLAPLVVLTNNQFLNVFTPEQLQAAVLLSLKLHAQAFNIGLVCFAVFDLLIGYLIVRSTFLPRILGALMVGGGAGWLTVLWPPLATSLAAYILPLGGFAELALMLWLIVRGVDIAKWQETAGIH